ncbi:MAG: hypothetical protein KAQ84_03505, partial [Thermoplasmatales archaeon]|nr:hypothetical protein [Thermoplasmatales archaeon]
LGLESTVLLSEVCVVLSEVESTTVLSVLSFVTLGLESTVLLSEVCVVLSEVESIRSNPKQLPTNIMKNVTTISTVVK